MKMTSTILAQLKETFKLITKKPGYIAYAALADMMCILTIPFFSSTLYDKMLEYAIAASSLIAKNSAQMGSIISSGKTLYIGLLSIDGVKEFAYDIIMIILLLALGIYIIYCFFQGISWFFAGKIAGSKLNYSAFMKSFLKLNIVLLGIYAIFAIIKLASGFWRQIASQPYVGDAPNISIMVPILAVIFIYLAAISYSRIFVKGKNGLIILVKESCKNAGYLIPRYLIITLIIAAIHFAQTIIFKYSIILSGIFFFAAELPSLTFARIFLIKIMEEKHETKNK